MNLAKYHRFTVYKISEKDLKQKAEKETFLQTTLTLIKHVYSPNTNRFGGLSCSFTFYWNFDATLLNILIYSRKLTSKCHWLVDNQEFMHKPVIAVSCLQHQQQQPRDKISYTCRTSTWSKIHWCVISVL